MIRVIVESPYAGNVFKNLTYLRFCLHDCIQKGEAPFASHGLYTQPHVLNDNEPEERKLGIECGYAWYEAVDKVVFYRDLGMSNGMALALARLQSEKTGPLLVDRTLPLDLYHEFLSASDPWNNYARN